LKKERNIWIRRKAVEVILKLKVAFPREIAALILQRKVRETDYIIQKMIKEYEGEDIRKMWEEEVSVQAPKLAKILDDDWQQIENQKNSLLATAEDIKESVVKLSIREKEIGIERSLHQKEFQNLHQYQLELDEKKAKMNQLLKQLEFHTQEQIALELRHERHESQHENTLLNQKVTMGMEIGKLMEKIKKLEKSLEPIETEEKLILEQKQKLKQSSEALGDVEESIKQQEADFAIKKSNFIQLQEDFNFASRLQAELIEAKRKLPLEDNGEDRNRVHTSNIFCKINSLVSVTTNTYTPRNFICPITQNVMMEPVLLIESGQTYEKAAIEKWLKINKKDPVTGKQILSDILVVNYALKGSIAEWKLNV
jgi:hypothetical protein